MLPSFNYRGIVELALREDLGLGDLTSDYVVPPLAVGRGRILAKEAGVIAGLTVAETVFITVGPVLQCEFLVQDGRRVEPGQALMQISGSLSAILSGERTALNFLQRLSGIATRTASWVNEIKGYPARLTDTRKTTPGLRLLEKYAVRTGGGLNHRLALDGGILIKENHIRAAGGIRAAVEAVRKRAPLTLKVEVEVTTLAELEETLAAGADIIMLDNMDLESLKRAVKIVGGRIPLEASGNVTFERLRQIAATGVDYISSGALTHSYRSLDLSMLIEK